MSKEVEGVKIRRRRTRRDIVFWADGYVLSEFEVVYGLENGQALPYG